MARNTPTELVLLEIASGLQELAKNPDLSQKIKDAYALSEAEQAKAEDARNVIAQADTFLEDLRKKQAALDDVNLRVKKAEATEAFNEDTLKVISTKQKELDRQAAVNEVAAERNAKETQRLADYAKELEAWKDDLEAEQATINEAKADLKKRSDIIAQAATI